jgi:small subunit ribosomal protein S19e
MVTARDVDPNLLIAKVAEKLEKEIPKPEFIDYVKSGAHTERPPEQRNFWWIRCAAILRKAYMQGRVGVSRLRRQFGKRKNRGVKPEKKTPAGGKIIRKALQELEKAGYLKSIPGKGRVITPKGVSLLDNTAYEIVKGK